MKVLDDYIKSLGIFHKCIEVSTLNDHYNTMDIFVHGQMWSVFPDDIMKTHKNIMFMNVEMLSESSRCDHVIKLLYQNVPLFDYSQVNIAYMEHKIKEMNIPYTGTVRWLPYQFNHKENTFIQNTTNTYDYDVGIINAVIPYDKSNNSDLVYKRNIMWDMVQKQSWRSINIMGWGKERDVIISKCKVIINVHNFDVFNIFEHIRCDRLLFANKIIVSDKSLCQNQLDIHDYVIWEEFDKIIPKTQFILDNFNEFNQPRNMSDVINNRKQHLHNTITTLNVDRPSQLSEFSSFLHSI